MVMKSFFPWNNFGLRNKWMLFCSYSSKVPWVPHKGKTVGIWLFHVWESCTFFWFSVITLSQSVHLLIYQKSRPQFLCIYSIWISIQCTMLHFHYQLWPRNITASNPARASLSQSVIAFPSLCSRVPTQANKVCFSFVRHQAAKSSWCYSSAYI